jgi:ABC-type molybdate transport system ATPase subunit
LSNPCHALVFSETACPGPHIRSHKIIVQIGLNQFTKCFGDIRGIPPLNLADYLDRKPDQLSGGQCQRVSIGRPIVRAVGVPV